MARLNPNSNMTVNVLSDKGIDMRLYAVVNNDGLVPLSEQYGEEKASIRWETTTVENVGALFARLPQPEEGAVLGLLITSPSTTPSGESTTAYTCAILGDSSTPTTPTQPQQPTAPTQSTVGGFTDVAASAYYADPVVWAVNNKITAGTSATTFSPEATCTQAQILTFLWRATGSPEPTGTIQPEGFTGTEYYYKAALWAAERGMITEGNFDPETLCTRAMAVTYMWNYAGGPASGSSTFTDVPAGASYAPAVAWAVNNGVTSGTGNNQFSPDLTCTRAQIVTFLYRAFAN